MRNRPWPIVVLACLYFLGPLFNTVAGAMVMKISYWQYLQALFTHSSWFELFTVFLLYPIAGFAIYSVKEWSYPIYIGVMAFSVYLNYSDYQKYSTVFTLPIFIITTFINIGLVSYFLVPAVRAAYFNKRLRWWESKPRYEISIPGALGLKDHDLECTILNLSEGGAFIAGSKDVDVGSEIVLKMSVFGRPFGVPGKVVHHQKTGLIGYGIQFTHTHETEKEMHRVAKAFALVGLKARGKETAWYEDLRNWISKLAQTGQGVVPDVPSAYLHKTEAEKSDKVK